MMRDPSIATALASGLETAINAALRYDPGTRGQLSKLAGKTLAIDASAPDFELFLSVSNNTLLVSAHGEQEHVTTMLSGSCTNIFTLLLKEEANLTGSGVSVSGKIGLLGDYQHVFAQLDIDWEDALSDVIGDLPAHHIASAGGALLGWLTPRVREFPNRFSEFVTEELRLAPSRAEAEAFNLALTDIRQRSERLEARLQQLQQRRHAQVDPE